MPAEGAPPCCPLTEILSLKYETSMATLQGLHQPLRPHHQPVLTADASFISGNRCERGLGKEKAKKEIPNLFDYKYHRMFDYEPLPADEAEARYHRYPPGPEHVRELSHSGLPSLKELRFRVILSPQSTRKIYELGIESIPSESECYPAKLVHGHISWLIRQGVTRSSSTRASPTSATETPGGRQPLQLPHGHLLRGEHQK